MQRINVNKTNHAIHWIVIYPVDNVIQPLNNPGLIGCSLINCIHPHCVDGLTYENGDYKIKCFQCRKK